MKFVVIDNWVSKRGVRELSGKRSKVYRVVGN